MRLTPLPAFEDNYIWTLADAGGHGLIVDPGDAAPVLAAAGQGLRPAAVLLTHHHGDHVGGIWTLRERWPDLPSRTGSGWTAPGSPPATGSGSATGTSRCSRSPAIP
jgi:hydroxyacylglutathione hydrolase